jgi:hypothetical protein
MGSRPRRMTDRATLPRGMTPRLLSREGAAAYCGMSPNHFDAHVAKAVLPLHFGRRSLWDIKALDQWLDQQSGLTHAIRSVHEWAGMLGDDRAGEGN